MKYFNSNLVSQYMIDQILILNLNINIYGSNIWIFIKNLHLVFWLSYSVLQ